MSAVTQSAPLVVTSKSTTPGAEVTIGSRHLPELAYPVPSSKCNIPGDKVTTGTGLDNLPSSGPAAAVAAAASRSKCGVLREVIVRRGSPPSAFIRTCGWSTPSPGPMNR